MVFHRDAAQLQRPLPGKKRDRSTRRSGWREAGRICGAGDRRLERIGAATAVELAAQGALVVLVARRAERLAELAERIAAAGGQARVLAADIAERGCPRRWWRMRSRRKGGWISS